MLILDGKKAAALIAEQLSRRVAALKVKPKLTIVQVGDNPASNKYIATKLAKAKEVGILTELVKVPETISKEDLKQLVKGCAVNTTGIIVQLPLPRHIDRQAVLDVIPYNKDVDGLASGNNLIVPATPLGIISLLKAYDVDIRNKVVAVVGQSNLVGKPVADLCEKNGAAKVNRYTKESGIAGTEKADILIVAAGEPNLIKKANIKKGAAVVDVGINTIADRNAMTKIVGDVDRNSVGELPSAISPVPGGVGPMTVISLIQNVVEVAERAEQK